MILLIPQIPLKGYSTIKYSAIFSFHASLKCSPNMHLIYGVVCPMHDTVVPMLGVAAQCSVINYSHACNLSTFKTAMLLFNSIAFSIERHGCRATELLSKLQL